MLFLLLCLYRVTLANVHLQHSHVSYEFGKYLAKLLLPFSTSECTVNSTSDFITHIKGQNIPNNFKLISFDVTSLFTNVPLDFTIDVILKWIYDENEATNILNTNIYQQQMRDLLLLSAKNVHFSYNGDVYTSRQCGMGFADGSSTSRYILVELERILFPTLREHISPWKSYVDDTISYIKEESIEYVLSKLNGYHDNLEFMYETENDGKLPFLRCTDNR